MRKIILILFLLIFIQKINYSQIITFNKDSVSIKGDGTYEDIKDSLIIRNSGKINLTIDSIYSDKMYLYKVSVCKNDTSYIFYIAFDKELSPIIIPPQDSIKLIFYMPDLCPICKDASISYFEDTLYVENNSINDPAHLVYISGQGITGVKNNNKIPIEFSVEQNYPNPFNPSTKIVYSLKHSAHVTLQIFDVLGRRVKKLLDKYIDRGEHTIIITGKGLSSGIYFYQLRVDKNIITKKMMLVR